MARIACVKIPDNKKIKVALTYIYGIGNTSAMKILKKAGVDPEKRTHELTDHEIDAIKKIVENEYKVEGALRMEVSENIKRLIRIKCYRGIRHEKGLPVRGQRTRTNARTRKGPRGKRIGISKKG